MYYKNLLHRTLWAFLFASMFAACGGNDNPETLSDEDPQEITFKERNDWPKNKAEKDALKYDKNYYTYIIEPGAQPVPVVEAEDPDDTPKTVKTATRENAGVATDPYMAESQAVEMNIKATRVELRENRPPLYDRSCLDAQYPIQCSNDKLQAYVKANLKYPQEAIDEGHDGYEFVLFSVNTEGGVENVSVRSKDKPCEGCAEAARKVIASMPGNWIPALRNGKAVAVQVVVPVSFDSGE